MTVDSADPSAGSGRHRRLEAREVPHEAQLHDEVTGLPNRITMAQIMHTQLPQPESFAGFLSVGIDELPAVTDAFGDDASDLLMREFSTRLQQLRSPVHALARIGPAEFGIFISDIGDERLAGARCRLLARELFELAGAPLELGEGVSFDVSLSVGCVLWADVTVSPANWVQGDETDSTAYPVGSYLSSANPDEVIKCSDIARKSAFSRGGRRRICYFEAQMQVDARQRIKMMSDLRHAIDRGELQLYSQPIVNRDRQVIGEEALLRWASPDRGFVSPGEFIPLAEQTGLIVDVGAWVINEACRTLAKWAADPVMHQVTLSVNLSAKQLRVRGFADTVIEMLHHYKVPAERLKFELTESVLHSNLDRTVRLLTKLRSAGVYSSLDDFGTGYSSLNYVRSLPVQQLKIDRSFVTTVESDVKSAAIVQLIVQLGRTLDLQVVVEGVESEGQFEALRNLGVDAFQGYLFSRPRPVSEVGPQRHESRV